MTPHGFHLVTAFVGGAALAGAHLFFLHRSVRTLVSGRKPGLRLLIQPIARISMVCTGLWVLGRGDGSAILAALLGFVVGRTIALSWFHRRVHRRLLPRSADVGLDGSSKAGS